MNNVSDAYWRSLQPTGPGQAAFEPRTIDRHYECPECKRRQPPQMVLAVFESFTNDDGATWLWRVKHFQCLAHPFAVKVGDVLFPLLGENQ